jgi:hypothetical protein
MAEINPPNTIQIRFPKRFKIDLFYLKPSRFEESDFLTLQNILFNENNQSFSASMKGFVNRIGFEPMACCLEVFRMTSAIPKTQVSSGFNISNLPKKLSKTPSCGLILCQILYRKIFKINCQCLKGKTYKLDWQWPSYEKH